MSDITDNPIKKCSVTNTEIYYEDQVRNLWHLYGHDEDVADSYIGWRQEKSFRYSSNSMEAKPNGR